MARDFNGSNQKIDFGDPSRAQITTGIFTLSAWINNDAAPSVLPAGIITYGNAGAPTKVLSLEQNASGACKLELFDGTNNPSTQGTANVAGAGWRHVAAWRSASQIQIYDNGTPGTAQTDTTAGNSLRDGSETWILGLRPDTFGTYFDGRIAEVGVWKDLVLTDAEVLGLSRGISPLMVHPEKLALYIPCFGRVSPEPAGWDVFGTVTGATQSAHPPMRYPGRSFITQILGTAPVVSGVTYPQLERFQPRGLERGVFSGY